MIANADCLAGQEQSVRPVWQMIDNLSEASYATINLCIINTLMKSILYIAALVPL